MAHRKDSKKNEPISINDLSIQDFEEIAKNAITYQNNSFYSLNQQLSNNLKNSRQEAEYSKEEILQMRDNNDKRLYKSPGDVKTLYSCVWENGKVGYFIPFEHRPLGGDFLSPQFGGGQSDGRGLRFVQNHRDETKVYLSFAQKSEIILSGFGEYVLTHWGQVLNELYVEYTNIKYKKLAEKWKKDHFPTKTDVLAKLNLLKELKSIELAKWNESTISGYLSTTDNEKLIQCMTGYFNWFDKCLQVENSKGEVEYIKNIKSGTITCGNGWANGKSGQFRDIDNNYLYRFCETDDNGNAYLLNEQEQRKSPVLAQGFIAWLIKKWGSDTQKIYSEYLEMQLNQFKSKHRNDPDVLTRNLDNEFYGQYKLKEEIWIKQSEAIFEFISDDEVSKINKYVQYYLDYFERIFNSLQINKSNINITKQPKDSFNKLSAEREINVSELGSYFNSSFRGIGENNINHFEKMVEDLKQNRSGKEFAEIALLIHESKHMNSRKPVYFSKWYQVFCEYVGCEQKKYDPKDLRPIRESVKNLFGYLLI